MMLRSVAICLVCAGCLADARAGWAADSGWLEIKSPHFTVVSSAGEKRAREVAWQFEQIRAVLTRLWPWATADFDRPVTIFAVSGERSMRALVPQFWEEKGGVHPASMFVSAADGHYVAVRTDVDVSRRDVNPYRASYWSYVSLVIAASFDRDLPLWLSRGLAELFSNTIVQDEDILIGPVIPWHLDRLRQTSIVPLDEQFRIDRRSPYMTKDSMMPAFDASCWALLHYLTFGNGAKNLPLFNQFASAVRQGADPVAALDATYGGRSALDAAFRRYLNQWVFVAKRVGIDVNVDARAFVARALSPEDAAVARARLHAATDRRTEARALLAEARAGSPAAAEIEGMLLEREQKTADALRAYAAASDAERASFYGEYRFAMLSWPALGQPSNETLARMEKSLRRAVALNAAYPHAHALLGDVLSLLGRAEEGLPLVQRALALAPGEPAYHLSLARVLWRLHRRDEAIAASGQSLARATTDDQRKAARDFLTFLAQQTPSSPAAGAAGRPPGDTSGGGATTAAAGEGVDPGQRSLRCQPGDTTACAEIAAVSKRGCDKGIVAACASLASLHHQGLGVAADPPRALALYEKACDAGERRACVGAGVLLADGAPGVSQDTPRAEALFEKTCQSGALEACTRLALLLARRQSGGDLARARELLTRSCEGGDAQACSLLTAWP